MTEVEEGIDNRNDLVEIYETVDLQMGVHPPLGIKVKEEGVYCREPRNFIRECQKKKWDQGKQGEQKNTNA